jgi:hypothetical protein
VVPWRIREDFVHRISRDGWEDEKGGGHAKGTEQLQAGQHGIAPEVGKYSENGFHRSPRTLGAGGQIVKPSFGCNPIKIKIFSIFEIAVTGIVIRLQTLSDFIVFQKQTHGDHFQRTHVSHSLHISIRFLQKQWANGGRD